MNLAGLAGRSASSARHSLVVALVTRSCGGPQDALEAEDVTEARDDGVAAAKVALQVQVGEGQQAGLDQCHAGVPRDPLREAPGGANDGPDADAAGDELLQEAPAGSSGAANEKHGLLTKHGVVSLDAFHSALDSD
jgi:hypothetical protein